MTDKDALKIASWLVEEGGLCEEETEYCNKSCTECCYEVQKRLRQMAQDMGERTMTNKEAIERLKEGAPFSGLYVKEWEEAVSLGIKALEFIEENYPKTFDDYLKGEE